MLVEDNPTDTRLVRAALAEHPVFTFQVAHFQNIDDALKFLERDVVDVALLDYRPESEDLGGLALIVSAAPNLPVVMLTGVEDDATGLRMMQQGAQDYIVKGTANAAMLVRTIRQAIERKTMSDRVRDSEERFTLAAAGAGDGIWDWHIATDRMYLSSRAGDMTGVAVDEPMMSIEAFTRRVHLDDVGRFGDALAAHLKGETADFRQQVRVMVPNEGSRWLLIRGVAESEAKGRARRMAGSITDLSNLDAYYDSFTGLPNRTLLIDRLRSVMKRRPVPGRCSALLLVLLSRYDNVVDTMGQVAGDSLMTGVARVIDASARPGDMVARTGVREIAVVLDGIAGAEEAMVIAGRVCHGLLAPILIDGEDVVPEIRMGVVLTGATYTDPEAVMHDATAALETDTSDLPYCIFNLEMRERASERLRIEGALRRAVERDALKLVYQPIVAVETGVLRGFEALLRWQDPAVGEVPPSVFVPIAEELGLIREIGSWVLRTACRQIVAWRTAGLIAENSDFTVSVNISGRQLDDADAIDHLMSVITESGVPPRHLTLELTETALFANPERAREALMAIKLQGVSLAMDDFGTGYSSLSYLGRFPFDKLKIDRSFVGTIAAGVASPLLKGMLGLSREIGLHVVAEGVETTEQRDVLAALHCQDAQGWLFGRPLSLEQAEALLVGNADAVQGGVAAPSGRVPAQNAEDTRLSIDGVQRRNAVIVATEIVGYARMMGHDEGRAVYTLADVRRVIDPMIVAYRGRILGIAGASYMLEFDTTADAVSWALALQRAMGERNAGQP